MTTLEIILLVLSAIAVFIIGMIFVKIKENHTYNKKNRRRNM